MQTAMTERVSGWRQFGDELADFIRFVFRPTLRRLRPRTGGTARYAEWWGSLDTWQLLRWALLLWVVNIGVLGPIAVSAAGASGSEHRLSFDTLQWARVLLLAPLLEESMFRYVLRQPIAGMSISAMLLTGYLTGVVGSYIMVGALLFLGGLFLIWPPKFPFAARRTYRRFFPWLFHASAIGFALLHLFNFQIGQGSAIVLLLLVLPQYLSGLVMGWLRVRQGFGACLALHALFNLGPLVLLSIIVR